MYEDWTQNYDPEIHEQYLVHMTLAHPCSCHIMYSHAQSADYSTAINTTHRLKGNYFLL